MQLMLYITGPIMLLVLYIFYTRTSNDQLVVFVGKAAETYPRTGHPTALLYVRIAAATICGTELNRKLLLAVADSKSRSDIGSTSGRDQQLTDALCEISSFKNMHQLKCQLSRPEFRAWRKFDLNFLDTLAGDVDQGGDVDQK